MKKTGTNAKVHTAKTPIITPNIFSRISTHLNRRKQSFIELPKTLRITSRIAFILVILLTTNIIVENSWKEIQHPAYGVSFSVPYAQELGVDWKANYASLLDDLQIRNFRLMSYWELHEPKRGTYDYSTLDYQMDEAAKRGAKVTLSIGFRQPRWPECHEPGWAADLKDESLAWRVALNDYIKTTVERYKNHPALLSYQLENEAVNGWFGTCKGAAPRDRLQEEFALVKKLDQSHPVWMNLSDQHGFPISVPNPDAYGFSVYRTVWNDKGPFDFYLTYPTPIWYHRIRKALIEQIHNRPVYIHELQVEPWCPVATKDCTIAEQNKSMSTNQIHENFTFARKIGSSEIYTWGGEWWYWRKTKFNDAGPWEAVRNELSK
jgi:hypothetical protein